ETRNDEDPRGVFELRVTTTKVAALVGLVASLGGVGQAHAEAPPEGPVVDGPWVSPPASPNVLFEDDRRRRRAYPGPIDNGSFRRRLRSSSNRTFAPCRRPRPTRRRRSSGSALTRPA